MSRYRIARHLLAAACCAAVGHAWIADLIYTRCQGACPLLTARMVQLQRAVPDDAVRFVSFSVDPEHDTPAELAAYARTWHADERRWRLLATDRASLTEVATGLGLTVPTVRETGTASRIMHSDDFALIDGRRRVVGIYDSADPADIKQLVEDTKRM